MSDPYDEVPKADYRVLLLEADDHALAHHTANKKLEEAEQNFDEAEVAGHVQPRPVKPFYVQSAERFVLRIPLLVNFDDRFDFS